jgi:hypothetical protein
MILKTLAALFTFAALLLAVACGDDDNPSSSGEPTPSGSVIVTSSTVCPDNGFQFEINEVGLGDDGYVQLRNYTDTEASLAGLFLCQPPKCVELPDVKIGKESNAIVALGDGGDRDGVVVKDAELTLSNSDGELALFAGNDVSNSGQIRSYLQWGSSPHEGTGVAIEAGLWIEGSYAPTSPSAKRLYRNADGLWLFD